MTDIATLTEISMPPTADDAPTNVAVWFELPAEDLGRAVAFYRKVLKADLRIDTSGPNPMADFPTRGPGGVGGHLYPGKPADGAGPTVHFVVPDTLEATMARCFDAGGTASPEIIPLPMGRFAYASDSEGNSIGFYQPD